MALRNHQPVTIDNFEGLWDRGDEENVPINHFTECQNLINVGKNITVRPGVGLHQDVAVPLEDVRRMYNYPTQTANTILALVINDDGEGEIFHVIDETTVFGPILTIDGMTDFAFVPYAGRAYISPFSTFVTGDLNIQKGLEDEVVYVYPGDGTAARPAAGSTPAGTLTIANGAAGNTDPGLHIFAVVGETDTGFLSTPFAFNSFTTVANQSVSFGTVPVLSGAQWVRRHIIATPVIASYNGNLEGYPLFFIPGAVIENNTDLFLNNISFFDDALLDDASYLLDNLTTIPAGACVWLYHNRLCVATTFDDISLIYVSAAGEPEAISEINGIIIVPLDGNPITNGGELRDIMYVFKRSRTTSYTDTGEEPSAWPDSPIDAGLGTCVHGLATVLDSGNANVDYLIICTYAGVMLFNGRYIMPELSWKVQDYWFRQDRNEFGKIQIINAPVQGWIVIVLPDGTVLTGDYNNAMDPKSMRWYPWVFNIPVNCIAIVNIDDIIIGSPIYEGAN